MYAHTHLYIHIYFTACEPPKHQRVMSGRRNQVFRTSGLSSGLSRGVASRQGLKSIYLCLDLHS